MQTRVSLPKDGVSFLTLYKSLDGSPCSKLMPQRSCVNIVRDNSKRQKHKYLDNRIHTRELKTKKSLFMVHDTYGKYIHHGFTSCDSVGRHGAISIVNLAI